MGLNVESNDWTESLRIYSEELKRCSPLTKEQERELLIKAKNGSLSAQNKILKANLRFVFNIAKKYKGQGACLDDLIAEGNMGMVKAIEKFDLDYDNKFFSYAVWWIKQGIQNFIKNEQTISEKEQSDEEINKEFVDNGVIEDEEDEKIKIKEIILPDSDEVETASQIKKKEVIVQNLLCILEPKNRKMIEMRFGLNGNKEMNLEDIGQYFNLSKERVRQICEKQLMKLRREALISNVKNALISE